MAMEFTAFVVANFTLGECSSAMESMELDRVRISITTAQCKSALTPIGRRWQREVYGDWRLGPMAPCGRGEMVQMEGLVKEMSQIETVHARLER
jgi:hypothetical protein